MNTMNSKSVRQLAKATGYSVGEVQRRRARGESDDVIAAAAKRRAGGSKPAKKQRKIAETFHDAQARKERALADLREMEAAHKRDELVEVADVNQVWSEKIAIARSRLLMLPSKVAPEVAVESDPGACQEILRRAIYEALTELSKPETYGL